MINPVRISDMKPYSLVISDIHLQPEFDHSVNQAFNYFIENEASNAEALYILGDLFEMWLGDDIGLVEYGDTIQKLIQLIQRGTPVYLQFGNRDFLMKQKFFTATGIQALDDIHITNCYGHNLIMLHGDLLCTDDVDYQRFRRWVRNPIIQWIFLAFSRPKRLAIGNKMRRESSGYNQNKPDDIMDVNMQAVQQLFQDNPTVYHMIHGHTHKPGHHTLSTEHAELHRWVMSDWQPDEMPVAQIIKLSESGPELIPFQNY